MNKEQDELDEIFFKTYPIKPIPRNNLYIIRRHIKIELSEEKLRLINFISKVEKIPETVRVYYE